MSSSRKFWKSPFFYVGLVTVLLATFLVAFFIGQNEQDFSFGSSKRNIFDESQYLFSEPNKPVGVIDLNILGGTVLAPTAPAFLVPSKILATLTGFEPKKEIEEYVVQLGDTVSSVAEKFAISLETVLWANNLSAQSVIQPGQKLVILPVTGIMHIVKEGDTVSEIAELYQAKAVDIIDFNELSEEGDIFAGDFLIIPEGKKPKIVQKYVQVPLSQSYFICPIPSPCRITQGLHWYNAVDFGNGKCGEPVFAAAGGTVQRTGYGSVSGYYVRLLHPNGVVTFYGHLSKVVASPGQKVYQGQIIGYIGHSGITVPRGPGGCHLHLDVRFATNPFAKLAVGTKLGK